MTVKVFQVDSAPRFAPYLFGRDAIRAAAVS